MNTLHLSTAAFRQGDATEGFREVFGRAILNIEIEPRENQPFTCDMTLRALPGVAMATGTATPAHCRHLASQVDNDDLVLVFLKQGSSELDQQGRRTPVMAGNAALTSNGEPATFHNPVRMDVSHLRLSRARLVPGITAIEQALRSPVLNESPALRLLRQYLDLVPDVASAASLDLQRAIVDHVYDLAALALGATQDAAEVAHGRGVRAARLRVIQKDILQRLTRSDLSVAQMSRLHHISPGYIRQLFAAEQTTFTQFVLDQRLALAYRMLGQARYRERPISDIAFDCGFSDLSYFNRSFKRRYGETPSDVRNAS